MDDAAQADVSAADTGANDDSGDTSADGTTAQEGGTDGAADSGTDGAIDSGTEGAIDSGMDSAPPIDSGPAEAGDARVDAVAEAAADVAAEAAVDGGRDAATDGTPDGTGVCSCGVQSACVSGACVPARRVFVSSQTYDGKLGGHSGADSTCQTLATNAGLGGTWLAWISDSTSSPNKRFTKATVAYRRLDGALVAANWTALASGDTLGSPIDLDETGASLASATSDAAKTWTATATDGTSDTDSCTQFTASTSSGEVGSCTSVNNAWTVASMTEPCSAAHHVYCFEQ
jgi:hypothetical protein